MFAAGYYCGVLASVGFGTLEDVKSAKPVKMISEFGVFLSSVHGALVLGFSKELHFYIELIL